MKKYKCMFCEKTYLEKNSFYTHLEKEHDDQLGDLTPSHFYFNFRNKKTKGSCVIDSKETTFNEKTEKYNRFCSQKCIEVFKKRTNEKMIKIFGKTHLLDDPERQKELLKKRKISGVYKWSDGTSINYTGSYEYKFLEFMDKMYGWNSTDIISPAPFTIKYIDPDTDRLRFYIPDVFIPTLNLIIEIKTDDDNGHSYRERENQMEHNKEVESIIGGYNYIKIEGTKFNKIIEKIEALKNYNAQKL